MPTPSDVFTQVATTTDRNWSTKVADAVSEHNAALTLMKKRGNIKTKAGGEYITLPIEYAENGTIQNYVGYELLNTSASDVLTSARFDWMQKAMHVTCSGRELRQNSGEEAMIDLVKSKKKNAIHSATNALSTDIYSDGSLPQQMQGFANLIQTNGQGTVGGLDASVWTFWQNKFREMTGTDLAATPNAANAQSLKTDMNRLWLSLVRGADKTDLILSSHDLYILYETGEQQLQRYMDADLAQAGFANVKFKSAPVVFDDNANFATNAEKMYFLDTKYLYMFQHREAQWTQDKEKRPTNQDAVIIPYYWMGNMATSNRARQGVLFDAA